MIQVSMVDADFKEPGMRTETMKEDEKLKNPLCIRWDDASHMRLTDTAWKMRVSASELVRRLVDEGLQRMDAAGVAKVG